MSVDYPAMHAEVAQVFLDGAVMVDESQWDSPTPCEGWTVRDLVNHVVAGNFWAAELVGGRTIGDVGDAYDGDVLGDQPSSVVEKSTASAVSAFRAPGAMTASCAVSYGPVPGKVYCGHRIVDLVGHAWDLATATGQDATREAAHVAACLEILEPQFELLAASGLFGGATDPGASAEPQARLLSMLGRGSG
ncbi:MAG TPA: TIGR03086 family metal-binding protein [Acidimicrobiales bacterium]